MINEVTMTVGFVIVSFFFAMILSMTVEVSLMNLETLMTRKKDDKKSKKGEEKKEEKKKEDEEKKEARELVS